MSAVGRLRSLAKPHVDRFLAKHQYRLVSDQRAWTSETSKCRDRLAPYCVGYGLDLGFGGDPITENAIRMDFPQPYGKTGSYPVQLGGDATQLVWFKDGTLDYVYSSHLLEDFEDTKAVLLEWLRVLKTGGRLIIFCPDQAAYHAHHKARGIEHHMNPCHVHADFSLAKVTGILHEIGQTDTLHETKLIDDYSWELVAVKR